MKFHEVSDEELEQSSPEYAKVQRERREERNLLWRQLRGQLPKIKNELRMATMVAFELGEDELGRELRETKDRVSLHRMHANEAVEATKPEVVRESQAD